MHARTQSHNVLIHIRAQQKTTLQLVITFHVYNVTLRLSAGDVSAVGVGWIQHDHPWRVSLLHSALAVAV